MNSKNYKIVFIDGKIFNFKINEDFSFSIIDPEPENLVEKINEYIKSLIPVENIHKLDSANASDCSKNSDMHSINSDDSYSGEGYNAFGLKDYEVYSFIIANISAHKSDDVYFKFINWDDNCDFVKNLESKDDFLKKLDLIEIEHGIAVIPWGPSITGHWATMLVDLKTKELYVFDSTIQNFEDEQSKTEAFGVLSDEVKLINNEVQSEKAGTCGIWTLCACVEFSLYNNIHDIIDNNQKIKSEVLNKIACIGRNIVDFTREKIRYKNTDSRYSKEGHSYFCKGKQLGLM